MNTPRYTDFVNYILGITGEIWEGRRVDLLHEVYSEDILVRSPEGVTVGNRNVIAATMATIAEFPDRQLLGEDVIWEHAGSDSWYSSHRIMSTATYSGNGKYGPASSRRLHYRVIADCHAAEDSRHGWQINDEWLVRDQGAIARQLGFEPRQFVEASLDGSLPPTSYYLPDADSLESPYGGTGNDAESGKRLEQILQRLMRAEFSVISREYDRAVHLGHPGGDRYGRPEAEAFWLGLRSAFPDAEFQVWHRIGRSDPGLPDRAAIRWTLEGKHSGHGLFGRPTGKHAFILGITHAEFGRRGLRAEYTLIDEISVWRQLLDDRDPCPHRESNHDS